MRDSIQASLSARARVLTAETIILVLPVSPGLATPLWRIHRGCSWLPVLSESERMENGKRDKRCWKTQEIRQRETLANVCEDVAEVPWTEGRADVDSDVLFVWHMEWNSGHEDDGAAGARATCSLRGATDREACHARSVETERSTVIECVQLRS
jgi:hypothetical protein